MLKRLEALLQHRHAPLFLLGLTGVLAYGLVLARTGFYWDDLPMSWIRYELGPRAMTEYFSSNRPVWGLLYQLTTRLLPQVPVAWQAFALLWRLICAGLVWGIGRELWPGRAGFAAGLGLLFLVYPGFNGQWTAYLYSHFFIVLAFFLFSLLCSLLSLRLRSGLWLVLGLVFSALNLWMMEYFFVLELARGALLWVALRRQVPDARQRTLQTLKHWWPYLALFGLAVLSRLFIFNNQVYGFGLLPRLREDFGGTLLELLRNISTSLKTVTLQAWLPALQFPNSEIYGPRTLALYAGLIAVLFVVLLAWYWAQAGESPSKPRAWEGLWFVGLGLVMLPLAGAPFWLIGLPVTLLFPANRATIPSMLPVALIVAGLFELVRSARLRYVLLALLVAFVGGRQFLWGLDFSRDWEKQKNFFWQMTWRAPGLRPDTLVLLNEGAFEFYADNSLSAALNWIYAPGLKATGSIPYVLFHPTNRLKGSLPTLKPDQPISYNYLAGRFTGSTSQVVAFYYLPPGCLRLLDHTIDRKNAFIPDRLLMRESAALSSPGWITQEQSSQMPAIYGPEPAHGWCFYFEKADLMRQAGDWQQVARLGDEAFALNDYPNDPAERFVFIEGYAHVGDWEKALQYSLQSHRVSPDFVDPMLCKLWGRIEAETSPSAEKEAALAEVRKKFSCSGE
jgi:hypothetical protein